MAADYIHDTGEAEFRQRRELESHLAYESFVALARHPGRVFLVDRTLQRREVKRGFLLVLAWMLSKRIGEWTDKQRVGIVFPPGMGSFVANLAVVFAGKVPVNLNFTLGLASAEACLRKADIDCLLTAPAVQSRMPDFPWPEEGVVDVVETLKSVPKFRALRCMAAIWLLPAKLLARWLKVPRIGGDAEAGLLFTSGSVGEPKGVALSHRNVLGNCAQIDTVDLLTPEDKVIVNLPIFHSFGFTVTLWYPLLRGCSVVSLPSPLEVKKVAEAVEAEEATILIGTPTFLRPYLKRVERSQLLSLKAVIAGAEKTPDGFAETWEARFGSLYLEGYGLTETSPVVSVNLPKQSRHGSVGPILPGHTARILNPDTRGQLPVDATGILALRGPNVFTGYLDDPERTAEVMDGDWFITGDLARIDADGFLHIEGRLSRFSKIGGEMVPHGTIEEALNKAFDLTESEMPLLAVDGRPDSAKGEVLVLLAAIDLDLNEVREKLSEAGLTNLWIPKEIRRVKTIPTLATGKLDLRMLKELVQ